MSTGSLSGNDPKSRSKTPSLSIVAIALPLLVTTEVPPRMVMITAIAKATVTTDATSKPLQSQLEGQAPGLLCLDLPLLLPLLTHSRPHAWTYSRPHT